MFSLVISLAMSLFRCIQIWKATGPM